MKKLLLAAFAAIALLFCTIQPVQAEDCISYSETGSTCGYGNVNMGLTGDKCGDFAIRMTNVPCEQSAWFLFLGTSADMNNGVELQPFSTCQMFLTGNVQMLGPYFFFEPSLEVLFPANYPSIGPVGMLYVQGFYTVQLNCGTPSGFNQYGTTKVGMLDFHG